PLLIAVDITVVGDADAGKALLPGGGGNHLHRIGAGVGRVAGMHMAVKIALANNIPPDRYWSFSSPIIAFWEDFATGRRLISLLSAGKRRPKAPLFLMFNRFPLACINPRRKRGLPIGWRPHKGPSRRKKDPIV